MGKMFRCMVVAYGVTDIEADTEQEALEKCEKMANEGRHGFDWSDPDEAQVVEELDC